MIAFFTIASPPTPNDCLLRFTNHTTKLVNNSTKTGLPVSCKYCFALSALSDFAFMIGTSANIHWTALF